MKTTFSEILEKYIQLSDIDFNNWILNNTEDLLMDERQAITYAYECGYNDGQDALKSKMPIPAYSESAASAVQYFKNNYSLRIGDENCDFNYYQIRAGKCPHAKVVHGKIYCQIKTCREQ